MKKIIGTILLLASACSHAMEDSLISSKHNQPKEKAWLLILKANESLDQAKPSIILLEREQNLIKQIEQESLSIHQAFYRLALTHTAQIINAKHPYHLNKNSVQELASYVATLEAADYFESKNYYARKKSFDASLHAFQRKAKELFLSREIIGLLANGQAHGATYERLLVQSLRGFAPPVLQELRARIEAIKK